MSAMAETVGQNARRPRGLWVALALSLTLNVFVIGGLVWAMLEVQTLETPAQRFIAAGRALALTDPQRAALRQFGITARQAARALHQSNEPVVQNLWAEMAKPQPDATVITRLLDQSTQYRRDYMQQMTSGLILFLGTLPPDERSQFAALAHRPQPVPHAWHFTLP